MEPCKHENWKLIPQNELGMLDQGQRSIITMYVRSGTFWKPNNLDINAKVCKNCGEVKFHMPRWKEYLDS